MKKRAGAEAVCQGPMETAAGGSPIPDHTLEPEPDPHYPESLIQYRVPGWALGTHRGRSPTVCGSHEDPG